MKFLIIILILLTALLGLCLWLLKTKRMTMPFFYYFERGYTLGVAEVNNPQEVRLSDFKEIEKKQFGLHPEPRIMADPFIVRVEKRREEKRREEKRGTLTSSENIYYIFYEELTAKWRYPYAGNIAVLESRDGKRWSRKGVCLREKSHTSFPNVFEADGEWYMLPEMNSSGEMRIYKATDFPMHWEIFAKPFVGRSYSDPMIYRKDGVWYLWFHTFLEGDDLRLFVSNDLDGVWREHPCSPIRTAGNDTRPAGRISEYEGRLLYFIQDHSEGYGTGVIAYEITQLSPTDYADERLADNPLLWRSYKDDWAKDGVHHLSYVRESNGKWLCVTDGRNSEVHKAFDILNFPEFNF